MRAEGPCPSTTSSWKSSIAGIEHLLDRPVEAVDLVDEEDVVGLERGEHRGEVALALQHRAAGDVEAHPELGRDDAGQRGLAEPRRTGEQHVIEGLGALARRLEEDAQLLLHALLPDEVVEPARAQRAVELVLRPEVVAAREPVVLGSSAPQARPGRAARGPPRRGRTARRPGPRRPPRAGTRAPRGRRARTGARRRLRHVAAPDAPFEGAQPVAQLQHDALGGALADPAGRLQPRAVAAGDRQAQLVRLGRPRRWRGRGAAPPR